MLANVFRRSYLTKFVSVFLTVTFFSLNNSFAIPENDIGGPADIQEKILKLDDIGVAIDSGTIKETYDGGNNKIIVHIQDAHCHYEAQSNISKILDQVTKECGIEMISVEGAEGIVDTAWFRAFPDAEIRKEVANYFMKKGEITGAEFFSINSDYQGTIFGAETRDYYIQNLKAFTEVYPYKESIEKYLKGLETIANRLKTVVYTPELKELDMKIRAFDSKDLELSEFAEYLSKTASKVKVDIKDYQDFKKLLQTLEYERKIDFDTVDKERSDYIDVLSKKMAKEEVADLVAESIKFKKGHVKAVDFYTYLRDKAKEKDIDIVHVYPNLFYYYIYTKLYAGIHNENLFKDLDAIQRALKGKMFKNDNQRVLDEYSEKVVGYVNLVNIELTNDDYDAFNGYREKFSLEDVLSFFSALSERYGLGYSIDPIPSLVRDNLPNMVSFYEIAMKRDKALIDNTLERMKQEGKDRSVLIAGGFHTRGIKALLEKQGISYVVVTPRITKDIETPYIKVLTNQRTSLEDIITESAAMPGVNINTTKEDIVSPKGQMLAPLNKVFYTIKLLLEDRSELKNISDQIGEIDGKTLMASTEETYEEIISSVVAGWLMKQKKNENVTEEDWNGLVNEWRRLRGAFQKKAEKLSDEQLNDKIIASIIAAFDNIFASPGTNAIRLVGDFDAYEKMTDSQTEGMDKVIASLMSANSYKNPLENDVSVSNEATGKTETGKIEIVPLIGFREAIEKYNIENGTRIPLDVMVHPGTGKGRYTRMYLDSRMLDALNGNQVQRLANHEYYHIVNPSKTETDAIASLMDSMSDVRDVFTAVEKKRRASNARVEMNLLRHSMAMSTAASEGIGPEVVVVVTTSQAEADFWQGRLTDDTGMNGAGSAVRKDAVVLAVTEDNWDGAAGNGLGTLNGYVQAARQAAKFGLLDGVSENNSIEELINAFTEYCSGKATFMYHTAGKGTRTSPIPGSEINSKPSIKLPKMLNIKGEMVPVTILESVLMQTSIYADSRKDRMGVFWGDQVIINENDVTFAGNHHVEIFGQLVPLDEGIKAYGVLLPGEQGDCKQREKLPLEEVKALLPEGENNAYKSIGSFTVSLSFLNGLLETENGTLNNGAGKLDTDPDWWQPLTSTRNEYIEMMGKKGKSREVSGAQWDKMNALWNSFAGSPEFSESGLARKVGFTDVGERSFWWDYGQNKLFLVNMQLLTKHTPQGKAARIFFGITPTVQENEEETVSEYRTSKNWIWANKSIETKRILVEKMAEALTLTPDSLTAADFNTPLDIFDGKDLSGLLAWAKRDTRARTDDEALQNLLGFVGIDARGWISGDSIVAEEVDIKNSVVQNSTIKSGYLKNTIVINSTLTHVEAEDAVIIGSTVISLKALGGMLYNVVQERASVKPGQVLANVFHPELGRVEMRTTITRDGEWDFKKGIDGKSGAWVFDNAYKYAQLHALNSGVAINDVLTVKEQEIARLAEREKEILAAAGEPAVYEKQAVFLAGRRNIDMVEARKIIAHRMLVFGDVDYFTAETYSKSFMVTLETAKNELEDLASMTRETPPAEGQAETLAGIQKIRDITFSAEKADYLEVGDPIYTLVPERNRAEYIADMRALAFGTSGLRSDVDFMTDIEVYLNTRGYINFLNENAGLRSGDIVSIVGDLRPSTPRLMKAIGKAIEDEARALGKTLELDFGGKVSSPAGACRGIEKESFSIIVTGSHIPFNMNGIKYYMKDGEEVLKKHEKPILAGVSGARELEKTIAWKPAIFDEQGMFKEEPDYIIDQNEAEVREAYRQRYIQNFPKGKFDGMNIVFWKHSAVGADDVDIVLNALGAETISEEQDTSTFVPVDTEKVKPAMAAKLEGFAKKHASMSPAGIIFTDGDSDRPGVADENGQFLTGDKLGLLVTKYLKQAISPEEQLVVALPISTNIGVVRELEAMGVKLIKTQIGSPHVVKAMNEAEILARAEGEKVLTLGWEANGGFLLGSEFKVPGGGVLSRLATRDAMLPILAAFSLAKDKGMKLSELFAAEIPAVYNHTGGYESFLADFGVDRDGAMEIRKGIVGMLKPSLVNTDVVAIDYETMTLERRITSEIDGETVLTFERERIKSSEVTEDMDEWIRVKTVLESVFTPEKGFARIIGVDIMDGVQVIFDNGEISHIRPSGNDPVFRNYAMTSVSMDRAREIASIGETDIIPRLARVALDNMRSPGSQAIRTQKAQRDSFLEEILTRYNKFAESELSREDFNKLIQILEQRIQEKENIPVQRFFRLGPDMDNYNWGQITEKSEILALMGARTPDEKAGILFANLTGEQKKKLSDKFGSDTDEMKAFLKGNIVAERWFLSGAIDLGTGVNLPIDVLSAWPVEIFGSEHVRKFGAVNDVTGKQLDSKEELSLQIHKFDEQVRGVGTAYIGLKTGVTADQFYQAALKGTILDVLNKVELDPSKTYIVPAYLPHAYGNVTVFETKAVTPEEDATGTISFFDRLKFLSQGYESLDMDAGKLRSINPGRWAKDVLTMEEGDSNTPGTRSYVREWLHEAEKRGALAPVDMRQLEFSPRVVEENSGARFEIIGEVARRFIGGEYVLSDKSEISSVEILRGRYHPLVVKFGTVELTFNDSGKTYKLDQGDEFLVYAIMGPYTIKAIDGEASVYTQVKPLPKSSRVILPNENSERIGPTGERTSEEAVIFDNWGSGLDVVDNLTIIDSADKLPIIGERDHTVRVTAGSVVVVSPEGDELYSAAAFDKITIPGNLDYKINSTGSVNAKVEIEYERSEEEKTAYAAYEAIKKHIPAMKKNKVDLVLAKELFAEGADSANRVGTRAWFESEINKLLGSQPGDKEKIVRIMTYNNALGLEGAVNVNIRDNATGVFGVTQENISRSRDDKAIQKYIRESDVRIMSLSKIDSAGEYCLTREIALTGLMQALLDARTISQVTSSLAIDMEMLMSQMTGKKINRNDLYYLLPYKQASEALEIMDDLVDDETLTVSIFLGRLVLKLTLKKIEPYDARHQLEMRKKVMYSV